MDILRAQDLEASQDRNISKVGEHLADFLHARGVSSRSALIHEAERWVPGDSSVEWEAALATIVSWGVRHGDLAATGRDVRIVPPWGIGPFEVDTGREFGAWAVRLHGAVNRDQLTARDIPLSTRTVIDVAGLGIGRVVLAHGGDSDQLAQQLADAGLHIRRWPASATRLLRREPLEESHVTFPPGQQARLVLHREFGRFAWGGSTTTSDQERSIVRVSSPDARAPNQYFLTRGEIPLGRISWSEVISHVWRLQLRARTAAETSVSAEELVLPTATGVEFSCRPLPSLLVQCIYAYDESADPNPWRTAFTLPSSLRAPVVDLVGQFLEALRNA